MVTLLYVSYAPIKWKYNFYTLSPNLYSIKSNLI